MDAALKLRKLREEKLLIERALKALDSLEKTYEDLLALELRTDSPKVSIRSSVVQALKSSSGPIHVKEILRQIESLGAHPYSARGDKLSAVDIQVVSLKNQGFPVERVAPRTWQMAH